MADKNQRLVLKDFRGGRNNVDPPQYLAETQVAEAVNVDWFNATLCRKRSGVTALTTTSSPFTGQTYSSLYRHVPTTDETAAELWATDDAGTPHVGRLTAGTAWATPTLKDAPTGNGWDFSYASLNGKLFIAYKSAVDRLHVWDPVSASVRRAGLAPAAAAPTAVDQGGGAYPAIARTYRVRYTEQRAGVTVRRSEPSPTLTFTPSGGGSAVTVTQPTGPSEGETHWELEASVDAVTFYRISTQAVSTASLNEAFLVTGYSSFPLSATTGDYTVQPSYRSIAADQGRLLGFGNYTTTDPQNQVQFSAVIGSTNVSDEERFPLNNYVGLDENDSGPAVAVAGPIAGSFFALKSRQTWKLTPTGTPTQPYNVIALSKTAGAVTMQAVRVGEDEVGNAALYWMSLRGPYRWSAQGIEYLGKAVEDKTIGANGGTSLNLAATHVPAHTLWYGDERKVFFWIATGANNDPDTILTFSVGRQAPFYGGYRTPGNASDGWSVYTGGMATARCSVMFANTVGASMSKDLKPYIGTSATTNTLGKCNTGTQDFGVSYQAFVTSQAYSPWPDGYTGSIVGAMLTGVTGSGVSIQLTTIKDFGLESRSDSVVLTATGSETRVQPRFGGAVCLSDIGNVQFTIGDAAAANNSWQLDDLTITWHTGTTVAA